MRSEKYNEIITDTILSNGYRVKIKNFTNMDKLVELPKSIVLDKPHDFRQIDSEITVYKDDKLIFKDVISNAFLEDYHHLAFRDEAMLVIVAITNEEDRSGELVDRPGFDDPHPHTCLFCTQLLQSTPNH